MKNQLIPFLFVVTLMFTVIACNKEDVNSYKSDDIALSTDVKPDLFHAEVVFHLSEIDLVTGQETGWVIDQKGMVRGYAVTEALSATGVVRNDIMTTVQMNRLNGIAQKVLFEVPQEDLSAMSVLIDKVDANALSDVEKGPDATSTTAIYAYRLMPNETVEEWQQEEGYSTSDSEEESCGGQVHSNPFAVANNYERLVINAIGASARNNTSEASQSISSWIADLNERKNL